MKVVTVPVRLVSESVYSTSVYVTEGTITIRAKTKDGIMSIINRLHDMIDTGKLIDIKDEE